MIWTTEEKIISLCWIQNLHWQQYILLLQWNIIISTKQLQFYSKYVQYIFLIFKKSLFSSLTIFYLLLQEGHNIFSKLSSIEYKQVLGLLKHCILATDLAVFFPNKTKLSQIVQSGKFCWSNQEHRSLIQAISMTACDLAASAKPWDIQVKTVKVIFEEFYEQGDAERNAGRIPIPMMDRNQPDQQASSQVGFLTGICIPCYTLLYELIPQTKALLNMCNENLKRWQNIDSEIKTKNKLKK